ncbi:PAS domain-containing protein [Methylobacterium mesophilicum]|uniref:PAS domain-containing protein n=1 Tax=Methylobacterium mesophilicum TaxID=39956 RepID=UPI001FCEAD10|nr:PAS domain-containing protein [Methylobacterium mesophilicum]
MGITAISGQETGPVGVDARTKRHSSARVAQTLAASGVGTWEWHIADDVLRCDAAAAAMLGVPQARAGRGATFALFLDRVHPEDRRRVGVLIDDLRGRGGLYIAQYRTVPRPGDVRWVLARGRFGGNAEGPVSEARGIVIDVTETGGDGVQDEATFCVTDATVGGIDGVAELALALFASAEAGLPRTGFERLKPLLDALLHEIGRQLVSAPPVPDLDSIH